MRSFFIRTSVAKESWICRATHEERRRVDWTFGIGYGDSYDYAKDGKN